VEDRRDIGGRVEPWQVDPAPPVRDSGADGIRINARVVQRPENERGVTHFGQRYGDARHLTTLDQRVAAGVQNFSPRSRQSAREEVLPPGAGAPILPFNDLHLRGASNEREREEHEEGVNYRDALRGFHLVAAVGV